VRAVGNVVAREKYEKDAEQPVGERSVVQVVAQLARAPRPGEGAAPDIEHEVDDG
jgi:hypothetical protein